MSFLFVGSLFVIFLGVFRPSWTPSFLLSNSAKHTSEDEAFFLQVEQNQKALPLFLEANRLYNQEKYEDAIPKFTDLIEKYPQSFHIESSIIRVVLSLHKNNMKDEIADYVNKFKGQFPEKELVQKILPLYASGMSTSHALFYSDPRNDFYKCLEITGTLYENKHNFTIPEFMGEIRYLIAQSFLTEKKYDQAYQEFDKITTEDFSSYPKLQSKAMYHTALCLKGLSIYDEAFGRYASFMIQFPNSQYCH